MGHGVWGVGHGIWGSVKPGTAKYTLRNILECEGIKSKLLKWSFIININTMSVIVNTYRTDFTA